ncbi:MAG: hypothetical protein J6Y58_05830 [Clostridiales bacterium]|nr:hypothetical protein [Clostridiales bacterium]
MNGYEEDKIRKNGIEEDALGEEPRNNGAEADAFSEEMSGDDQIKDALDTIEPSAGAKERMLANIRKKAAAAETAGSESAAPALPVRTADEMIKAAEERTGKAEPAEEPKKRSAARTWMWVVPALATVAAAVVILYVAGAFPKGKKTELETTPSGETDVSGVTAGGTDVSGIITGGPITECRSQEEMESFLKFAVKVPEDAESPRFFIEDGQVGAVAYKVGDKEYTLYAAKSRELLDSRKTGLPATSWEEGGIYYMKVG